MTWNNEDTVLSKQYLISVLDGSYSVVQSSSRNSSAKAFAALAVTKLFLFVDN